tara:strand:- start:57 stop:347 length:291 start_codon:yes stop_codon:yes gene_type:complete
LKFFSISDLIKKISKHQCEIIKNEILKVNKLSKFCVLKKIKETIIKIIEDCILKINEELTLLRLFSDKRTLLSLKDKMWQIKNKKLVARPKSAAKY